MKPNSPQTFWARVIKTYGCWIWADQTFKSGYGMFHINKVRWAAHRYSWQLSNGPIPAGMMVCHKCDNPPCVRPDHLFLGTAQDNSDDKLAKGRQVNGHRHHSSKLTEDDVIDIRTVYALGGTQTDLAAAYGVRQAAIHFITSRRNWKHLP